MTAHRISKDLHDAKNLITDPGASGTIVVDKSLSICNLVSATAETRTLSRPTKEGVVVTLHMQTDGGDITVTPTGGFNETGDTTVVFSDEGQVATFQSFQLKANGAFFWRLISHWGLGNVSPTESGSLDGLTASVTELNYADLDLATNIVAAGAGISAAETYKSGITHVGGIIITRIIVDLTGLVGSATDLDIIGNTGGATAAHAGQITVAKNGTLFGGSVQCLEVPAGGATDIDFYSATVGTGAQDVDVTTLTETVLVTSGGAWTSGAAKGMTTVPPANDFLYICNGAASGGTFTAGKFVITLYGV